MVEAAALPETLFTVWVNLFERGFAAEGDWVLIHGGTSGIGTMAIALGSLFGLKTIVTCGTDEKCSRALDLGADAAVNYRTGDFEDVAKQLTGGRGVDVVLDMVGGDYVPRSIQVMAMDGRHVSIAFLQSPKVTLNLFPVMLKRLTLTGSTLRARPVADKAAIAAQLREKVWPLLESRTVKPILYRTYPLSRASESHALMESSEHIGKIVLVARGEAA